MPKTTAPSARSAAASRAVDGSNNLGCLGRWRLVRLLGQGDWSRVYRVRPTGRPTEWPADYVLKTPGDGVDQSAALAMLRREAQLGRTLSHPHLAPVLAWRLHEPPFFVVGPYLQGVTLQAALAGGRRMGCAHALWITRQSAEALAALHAAAWRHADVKPANIHIAPSGHATLLDLGLAQPLDAAPSIQRPLVGSAAYAAPECYRPRLAITAAADVYSLGVVLFEMLAGRRPFPFSDGRAVAEQHLQQPPPHLRRLAPETPVRVHWLVRRMLAKEPLRRPSVEELVDLLTELEIESLSQRFAV